MSSTTTPTVTNEEVEAILNQFLEKINPALSSEIQSMGLDTWEKVCEDKCTIGKIKLLGIKAEVKAEAKVRDMTGLSSMQFQSVEVDSVDQNENQIRGKGKLSVELSSNLKAKAKGSVKASVSGLSESVSISGDLKAKEVTGSGDLEFSLELKEGITYLQLVELRNLKLKYKDMDVDIDGLGSPFKDFLNEVVDLFEDLYKTAVQDLASREAEGPINKALQDGLPYEVN
ncbi:MAG: hypothetical protein ACFB10_26445 [Salibacteraceae bacterium]